MNITVHIGRVVLDGLEVSRADAEALRRGLEGELTHLLEVGGLAPELLGGRAISRLQVGTGLAASRPAALGAQLAQAVYGGIGTDSTPIPVAATPPTQHR